MMNKPFSQACENNKYPILAVLKESFKGLRHILEIGSGTGQHAVFFAENLPAIQWYSSDQPQYHQGINAWMDEANLPNLHRPISLNVDDPWPECDVDGVFSANTAHIMSWNSVQNMFSGVGQMLSFPGKFVLYGPFNRNGQFTSEGNARFDVSLRLQDPLMGIRNDEDIFELAKINNLIFMDDIEMPANNRILVFEKQQ